MKKLLAFACAALLLLSASTWIRPEPVRIAGWGEIEAIGAP